MYKVHEDLVEGEAFSAPHERTIKHLVAPWTGGSRDLWVGVTVIRPGSSSNPHAHAESEEVFYVLSGEGRVRVDNEEEAIGPGSCIFIPPQSVHQLLNTGPVELKVLAVTSPPFTLGGFKEVHSPRTA